MITVAVEELHRCLEELKPLFDPHWRELAVNQDKVPLCPNYPLYLQREAAGEVLCVVARERGAVVAYFVGFIAPGMHYMTCLTLTMDIFWLHPDYRAQDSLSQLEEDMLAELLFSEVKREAVRRGVKRPFYGSKVHKDCGAFFEQQGLVEVDRYFSAWWGE
jgi:hypothetical protein